MGEETPKCELCGEPMPAGETMFKYHGYSGPCPKSPLSPFRHQWKIRELPDSVELDGSHCWIVECDNIGLSVLFQTREMAAEYIAFKNSQKSAATAAVEKDVAERSQGWQEKE